MYLSVVTIHTQALSPQTAARILPVTSSALNAPHCAIIHSTPPFLFTDTPPINIRHAPIDAALKDTAQLMSLAHW